MNVKELVKDLGIWFKDLFAYKCPVCGAPMKVVRHQTGVKGEWFPVFHCESCHQEYILN